MDTLISENHISENKQARELVFTSLGASQAYLQCWHIVSNGGAHVLKINKKNNFFVVP
jgi:hypothetical protein